MSKFVKKIIFCRSNLVGYFGRLDNQCLQRLPGSVKKLGFAIVNGDDYNCVINFKPSFDLEELRKYQRLFTIHHTPFLFYKGLHILRSNGIYSFFIVDVSVSGYMNLPKTSFVHEIPILFVHIYEHDKTTMTNVGSLFCSLGHNGSGFTAVG